MKTCSTLNYENRSYLLPLNLWNKKSVEISQTLAQWYKTFLLDGISKNCENIFQRLILANLTVIGHNNSRHFLCPIRSQHFLFRLEMVCWESEPKDSSARAWKLSSRLFPRPHWLPLGLRGWRMCYLIQSWLQNKVQCTVITNCDRCFITNCDSTCACSKKVAIIHHYLLLNCLGRILDLF